MALLVSCSSIQLRHHIDHDVDFVIESLIKSVAVSPCFLVSLANRYIEKNPSPGGEAFRNLSTEQQRSLLVACRQHVQSLRSACDDMSFGLNPPQHSESTIRATMQLLFPAKDGLDAKRFADNWSKLSTSFTCVCVSLSGSLLSAELALHDVHREFDASLALQPFLQQLTDRHQLPTHKLLMQAIRLAMTGTTKGTRQSASSILSLSLCAAALSTILAYCSSDHRRRQFDLFISAGDKM